jgi:hypothetical protein
VAGPVPKMGFSFKDFRAISKESLWLSEISAGKETEKILKFKTKKTKERARKKRGKNIKLLSRLSLLMIKKTTKKIEPKAKINQATLALTKINQKRKSKISTKNKNFKSLFETKNKLTIKGKVAETKIAKETGVPTRLK